ncbi:MAG TPA: ABC transporter ATP-binding protein [Ilumatobacter sp.]|nr:ABC transporter ATP-binding protein [Ilumatobacter sp.]
MNVKAREIAPDRPVVDAGAPLLEVESLCVTFNTPTGPLPVVDHVGFSIERGATMGLVGESGAGKSVTAMALNGLVSAPIAEVTGRVLFDGNELVGMAERDLAHIRGRDIGMIFQEPRRSLHPSMTVGAQIARVVRHHTKCSKREAWARAVDMLQRVGISDPKRNAKAYPHTFSGGMCQRVMIALALACRPKLLIADEATTALDVTVQKQILELISDLQSDLGLSVIFITHDLGVVASMCDTVAVMYAGQVVEQSQTREVFASPKHPYTAGLLDSVADLTTTGDWLGFIPGTVPALGHWPAGCRFHTRCTHCVEPTCTAAPIPLTVAPTGSVRCARHAELHLKGIS